METEINLQEQFQGKQENKPKTEEAAAKRAVPPSYPPETREKCYQLFKEEKSLREIEKLTGVPRATVGRWSENDRWKSRRRAELRGKKIQSRQTDSNKPANSELTFEEQQEHFKEGMAAQALRLPEIIDSLDDDELISAADKIKNLDGIFRKALNLEEAKPATVINVALLARPITIAAELTCGNPEPATLPEHPEAVEAEILPEPVDEKIESNKAAI